MECKLYRGWYVCSGRSKTRGKNKNSESIMSKTLTAALAVSFVLASGMVAKDRVAPSSFAGGLSFVAHGLLGSLLASSAGPIDTDGLASVAVPDDRASSAVPVPIERSLRVDVLAQERRLQPVEDLNLVRVVENAVIAAVARTNVVTIEVVSEFDRDRPCRGSSYPAG